MENFNLTKSDHEDITSLMNISYSLLDNFIKLRDLEINGGYDSEEYKSTIECLKSTLSLEESFYNRFGNHPLKLQAILNEFVTPDKAWDINKDVQIANSNNREELVKRRIILRLVDKMCRIKRKIPSLDGQIFNNAMEISLTVKKDVINSILCILNLYLQDFKFQTINGNLENMKYNFAFLYQFVEEDFLANNFAINPELYWVANFMANLKRTPIQAVDAYRKSYASELLERVLQDALNHDRYSLRNKDDYANAIISQILIRAGLLFSGEEVVNELANKFQQFMGINQMMNGDNSAEKLVMEAINLHSSDRSLPKIVTLGVNR